MKKKRCGSCRHWVKWKSDGRGLCLVYDSAGKSDGGKDCISWKGKSYERTAQYLVASRMTLLFDIAREASEMVE